jgi:hypothetical protein
MPYRPEPVPPGATSPSCMLNISIMPPRLLYESCTESIAPVDVSVVASAKTAESATPNRCSTPSADAPTAVGTVPWCCNWNSIMSVTLMTAMIPTTAAIA